MKIVLKRYIVKIPSEITVFYCKKNSLLYIQGKVGKKILKLKTKIIIIKTKNILIITEDSSNQLKNPKNLLNTEFAIIKQSFLEVSIITYKKLKLIGVGFKVFNSETFNKKYKLLHFKLGYSHSIYFKIPDTIKIQIFQSTNLFISGFNYDKVSQIAALLKKLKMPDPYKGKGILYSNDNIKLKEGKKV